MTSDSLNNSGNDSVDCTYGNSYNKSEEGVFHQGRYTVDRRGESSSIAGMEYEPKKELIRNNQHHSNAKNIEPERRKKCEELLSQGVTRDEIVKITGLSEHSISAIKGDMTGLTDKDWKTNMANIMKNAGMKGANRLNNEIDNIHPNFLPTALGIIIDKIAVLQDQPTAVIEHRIQRISQDDINKMLKSEVIIDISSPDEVT